jgi:hypothetical protein
MATIAQLQKRIERAETRTNPELDVIYRLDLGRLGATAIPEQDVDLVPGQRLVMLTSIFSAQWVEVARG